MNQQISFQEAVITDTELAPERKEELVGQSWTHLWETFDRLTNIVNGQGERVDELEGRIRELERRYEVRS